MFAVLERDGRQFKIKKGDVLKLNRMDGEVGQKITFPDVFMVVKDDQVIAGTPKVDGASVEAVILEQKKDKKVIIFKKRRRQNYRRKAGHRQPITVLRVENIVM